MSRKNINLHRIFRTSLKSLFFAKPTHLALKLELKNCRVQSYRLTRHKCTG